MQRVTGVGAGLHRPPPQGKADFHGDLGAGSLQKVKRMVFFLPRMILLGGEADILLTQNLVN